MTKPKDEPSVSFLDDEPGDTSGDSAWLAPPPSGTDTAKPAPKTPTTGSKGKKGHRFEAELDVAELDDRGRPVSTWSARGRELERSRLAFMSRRMCYPGRHVIIAVHLIDSSPVPLFGKVAACEYEGDGLCRVDLELLEVPEDRPIRDWLDGIARRRGASR